MLGPPTYGAVSSQASAVSWWEAAGVAHWAAYQPKGAASLALSYVEVSGNGRDAGVGVAPTWDAVNGWVFNGSSQYLTTTFVPQTDQSQSVLVRFTNASGTGYILGSTGGGGSRHFLIRPQNGSNQVTYQNGGSAVASPSVSGGNLAVAGNQGYKNGVSDGGSIGAWTNTAAAIYIGARNNAGSPVDFLACRIQAMVLFDVALTGPQVAAMVAAMGAL
jgi:hypothetical protein